MVRRSTGERISVCTAARIDPRSRRSANIPARKLSRRLGLGAVENTSSMCALVEASSASTHADLIDDRCTLSGNRIQAQSARRIEHRRTILGRADDRLKHHSDAVEDRDLSALLDGLIDPFYALDGDWRFVHFNRRAEEHFGLKRERVLGRSIWDLFPGEVGGRFDRCFREVLATGRAISFETASVARSDSYVEFRVTPYGRGLAISFRNITPVRKAEDALRETQARLEIATAAADLGIWDWNLVANEMIYSDRAKAICGFEPGELVTFERVRAITHPDDHPRTSAMAARAIDPQIKEQVPYEYKIVRASDGQVRWVLAHGEAIFSKVGEVERAVRYVGTIQDITERKRAEEAVRTSERRLRLAIEAGRMAVWEYDIATDTVVGSPELNQLLGFPADANPSAGEMRARYYPGEQERLSAIGREAVARHDPFLEAEYRYVWPDGSLRWLLLRAEIVKDERSLPRTVIGVVLDITERKRAEERQHLLVNELNHRVKNTLATVHSMARQSFREYGPAYSAFEARLLALSQANDVLTRKDWQPVSVAEIVVSAIAPHRVLGSDQFDVSGPEALLSPRQHGAQHGAARALHERGEIRVAVGPDG